jgi:glycosyltransferase involved in cell wall biosynthesis
VRTDVSAVVPAFNEEAGIHGALEALRTALESACREFEIIVVDDGSSDGTSSVVEALASSDPRIRLLHLAENSGYGAALAAGFAAARYGTVFITDADGQFDMGEIGQLLPLCSGNDLVCGYRIKKRYGAFRRLASASYNLLVRAALRPGIRDVNCAFKAIRRDALAGLRLVSRGFLVNAELLARARLAGLRVAEVPVHHFPRLAGGSKVRFGHMLSTLTELCRLLPELRRASGRPAALAGVPPWFFAASRAAALAYVAAVFAFLHVMPLFSRAPALLVISETERSVSKDGILWAILGFRIYNGLVAAGGTLFLAAAAAAAVRRRAWGGGPRSAAVFAAAAAAGFALFFGPPAAAGWALASILGFLLLAAWYAVGSPESALTRLAAWVPWLPEAVDPGLFLAPDGPPARRCGLLFSALTAALCAAALMLDGVPGLALLRSGFTRLADGNFYGAVVDDGRLLACKIMDRQLLVFDLAGKLLRTVDVPTRKELQEVRFDPSAGEAYHFDKQRAGLLVLDRVTLAGKGYYPMAWLGYGGSAISAFDPAGATLAVALEDSPLLILKKGTFKPLAVLGGTGHTESLIFDKAAGRYLLSFYKGRDTFEAVSADGGQRRSVPAGRFQGGFAISEKRREVYLPLPLESAVLVYDAATLALKGRLRARFGVRGLACDDENGVLVAVSMCDGYAEAIDLSTGRRLAAVRAGYYLRQAALDTRSRRAFVTSMLDGVRSFSY